MAVLLVHSLECKRKLLLGLVIAYKKKKKGWFRSKLCEVKKKKKYRRVVGLVTWHTGVTV